MNIHDSDLAELRMLVVRVVGGIIDDPARQEQLTDDLIDWLLVQDFPIDQAIARLSAKSVAVALAAIDVGSPRRPPAEWLDDVARAPVAAQVAAALHVLCGLSIEDTAYWCRRPTDQVATLVEAFGPWRPLVPPGPAEASSVVDVAPSDVGVDHVQPTELPPPPLPAPIPAPDPAAAALPPPSAPLPPHAAPVMLGEQTGAGPKPGARGRTTRRIARLFTVLTGIGVVGATVASALALSEPPPRPSFRPTTEASLGPSTEIAKPSESPGCAGPDAQYSTTGELLTINVAGVDRQYRLFSPPMGDPPAPRGLIVAIPDLNHPTELMLAESGVEQLAIDAGAVAVTLVPVSVPGQWNVLGVPDDPPDMVYAAAVVSTIEQRLCIDPSRIAIIGKGSGGHFAGTVACAEPSRYFLVAMVAGAFRPSDCAALSDVTVVMVVGGADDIFPTSGGLGPGATALVGDLNLLRPGARYDPPAFDAAVAGWAQDLECDPAQGQAVFDGPPPSEALTGARLTECRENTSLITVSVTDAGHQWMPAASQIIREQVLDRRDR